VKDRRMQPEIRSAGVLGRLNEFATVSWDGKCVEVCWETLVRCLNTGQPVDVG